MTKSEIFKAAHREARRNKTIVGNYNIAFRLALKEIYSARNAIEARLVAAGLRVWEKGDHRRIYINNYDAMMLAFPALYVSFYKTGNISGASYDGEHISNTRACKLKGHRDMYYDCVANKWVCFSETARELFGI